MIEVMGTTLFEDGRWLLRHEGGAGNKVPLHGPSDVLAKLDHGGAKIFRGIYSRDVRGTVVGAHVRAIKTFEGSGTGEASSTGA
jgi:hypothetical protein